MEAAELIAVGAAKLIALEAAELIVATTGLGAAKLIGGGSPQSPAYQGDMGRGGGGRSDRARRWPS